MCIASAPRSPTADDRVEIAQARPVTAAACTASEDRHVALEQATGVGIGDHHPGDVRPQPRLERLGSTRPSLGGRCPRPKSRQRRRVAGCRARWSARAGSCGPAGPAHRAPNESRGCRTARRRAPASGAHRHGLHAGERDQLVGKAGRSSSAPCAAKARAGGCRRSPRRARHPLVRRGLCF